MGVTKIPWDRSHRKCTKIFGDGILKIEVEFAFGRLLIPKKSGGMI